MSSDPSNEAKVNLAINALNSSRVKSIRSVETIFGVSKATIIGRIKGRVPRSEFIPKSRILTTFEEDSLVQYLVDRNNRGFGVKLTGVEEMANLLLQARDAPRVGSKWAQRFVQRKEELKTRYSRPYDFQRALCEDPNVINAWFTLVKNMKAKYGIVDCDLYNFDETGFMIGMIEPTMIVTRAERTGRRKKVQPANRE